MKIVESNAFRDVGVKGRLAFTITDARTGEIIEQFERNNVVCVSGYTGLLHSVLQNAPDYRINHLKIGTDVGTGTEDVPEPADKTYDHTEMDVLYSTVTPLTIGFSDENTAQVSITLVGANVMDGLPDPAPTSVNFTSAALHLQNGKVFSYVRFPKVAISELINISIVWTLRV